MNVRALIPAAGVGRRFGTTLPKQYQPLAGRPILERSIARLFDCRYIDQLVVALSPNDTDWPMIAEDVRDRVSVTTGGAERADSVRLALQSMTDLAAGDWVLVHDAVRPCVTSECVEALITAGTQDEHGAISALPISDSIKREVGDSQQAGSTLRHQGAWLSQTPQLFKADLLRQALERAIKSEADVYDSSSAMEHAGYRPHLIHGSPTNFKLTFESDLKLARRLLEKS